MTHKEIFQKVLASLGINSKYELPKPWSEFFAENTPRVARTNSKGYNIFREYNRNKLLDMISVSMGLFTSKYCNEIMPYLYMDLNETRHDYAKNLMSLILELAFEEYSYDNPEWIDRIQKSEDVILIICWIVLRYDYWERFGTELQLRMFQLIYDFYKMFFYQLYLDKNFSKCCKDMVKDCFCSIMSLDYYKNKLFVPLRKMIRLDVKNTDSLSDSFTRVFNLIHRFQLHNKVYCINNDNCFFGYNDDDISIVKNDELSTNETDLALFFTSGRSYNYYSKHYPKSGNIDDDKQAIKKLISYRKLLVYTTLSEQCFMDKVKDIKISCYDPSGKIIETEIKDSISSMLAKKYNRSEISREIANNLESGCYISETQVINYLYDIWEHGAATIILNECDPWIRCFNRDECNVRREMSELVGILEANPLYANCKEHIDFLKLAKQKSLLFRTIRLLISLLWSGNMELATPYRQKEFTDLIEQLSFVRKEGFTDDETIKEALINGAWNMLHRTTEFSKFFALLSDKIIANADSDEVSEAQLKLQVYLVLFILWTNGLVHFVTDSENQDYENAFMKYMLNDNLYSQFKFKE